MFDDVKDLARPRAHGSEPGAGGGTRRGRHRRWRWILGTAGLLFAFASARPAPAQEVQVPLDENGRIERIDASLAQRLGMFVDRYPSLQEVRLFLQLPDSTHVLEITYVEDGRTTRVREPLSAAQVAEMRSRVTQALAIDMTPALDRSGRVELIAGAALVGLGFYGWGLPEALDVNETRSAIALYMLTSATSIAGPWIATRRSPVSEAMARLSFHGASRGIVRGLALEALIWGHDPEEPSASRDRRQIAAAMLTSVAEGIGGYWWARGADMSLGEAASVANGSDFGMLTGLAVAGLIRPDDVNDGRLLPALVLGGAAIGAPLGLEVARARGYSQGDARVMRATGIIGAFAGLAVADLIAPEEERPYITGALLGGIGGLAAGDRLARASNLSGGEARLVQLAAVAGGALGLGVAYLIAPDVDDATPFLTMGTLGATAGLVLGHRAISPGSAGTGDSRSGFRIDVAPRIFGSAPDLSGTRLAPGAVLQATYRLP